MVQMTSAGVMPAIDRQSLNRLETHFISPSVYRRSDVAVRQAKLARMVSHEIIPRLLQIHNVIPTAPPADVIVEILAPSALDISGLAEIVLGSDLEAAAAYVLVLRDRGLSMETLFVELLEPTARFLGEMWNKDECDFIDVTLGVARLQKLLSVFNDTHDLPELNTRRHVLMATTPGDQHSFGASMVERFLVAAGWQVQVELGATDEQIAAATRRNWFAVIGLTAGSERQLESLTETILKVRTCSQNQDIGVMVGGPIFTANPSLAQQVGADATAPNAPAAVLIAQKLFDAAAARRRRQSH